MKRTFKVKLQRTIIQNQTVEVEAADEANAMDMAPNHENIGAWRYDTDFIETVEAKEVE